MPLFSSKCPKCSSDNIRFDYKYYTITYGYRNMLVCKQCGISFSETKNSFIQGIRTPIKKIWEVLNSRTEGMSLNATCRIFEIAKNTLLAWERKFISLHHTLLIYSMAQTFIQSVIEGDEFYTKVAKNVPADQSSGWTIVLMDRASRFIWELSCGKKDRLLFEKAIETLSKLVAQTEDITLVTDGERRYGKILFEICHELLLTGKPGRPRKTLKRGLPSKLKTKALKPIRKDVRSLNTKQHAHNILKPQAIFQIKKHTPITLKPTIAQCAENVQHIGEKQTHMPNQQPAFNVF